MTTRKTTAMARKLGRLLRPKSARARECIGMTIAAVVISLPMVMAVAIVAVAVHFIVKFW